MSYRAPSWALSDASQVHARAALPVYAGLNSTSSAVARTPAALGTIALSVPLAWITTEAASVRPYDAREPGRRVAVVEAERVPAAV